MDKGGQNSCSLCKKNFGPAPYILSFPKWRICSDLINGGFNMALGELGKYRVFSRLSLMTHSPTLEFQSSKVIGNIKVRKI